MGGAYELVVFILAPVVFITAHAIYRLLRNNKSLLITVLVCFLILSIILLWKLGEIILYLSLI